MRTIAHIVSPGKVPPSSELHKTRKITFETMRQAKAFAHDTVDVQFYAAQYPEEPGVIPEGFMIIGHSEYSLSDFGYFRRRRKLPCLKDIFDFVYQISDAEFFIYTNVDIALQPWFYLAVKKIIDDGYDAFMINSRTIPARYQGFEEISLMYSEIGEPHIGHECFVFPREAYSKYILGEVGIGNGWDGRILLWNLVVYAKKFQELKQSHLTFHIGYDTPWKTSLVSDYAGRNKKEAFKILHALDQQVRLRSFLKETYPEYLPEDFFKIFLKKVWQYELSVFENLPETRVKLFLKKVWQYGSAIYKSCRSSAL